jgi:hypothetical protein
LDKVTFHMGWIRVTLDPLRRERLIRMTCTFPWSGLDFVFAGVLHEKQFREGSVSLQRRSCRRENNDENMIDVRTKSAQRSAI